MIILADENFHGDAVHALRDRGHDVTWILELAPGIADEDVFVAAPHGFESHIVVDAPIRQQQALAKTNLFEQVRTRRVIEISWIDIDLDRRQHRRKRA